jgi:hypothetical protein
MLQQQTKAKNRRIPVLLIVVFAGIISSCSDSAESDAQFCRCMEAGESLNKFSAELLERTPTAEDAAQMKKLRQASKKECERYYQMSGEELRKKKAACKKK